MVTKNVSKQSRLAQALVIICLLVVKATAYEEDFYIDQSNGVGIVMDVAANDVNHPDINLLRVFELATNGIAVPSPGGPSGRVIQYLANSGFFGFDTFRYDYGPFSPATRVWILVIPNDNATDAGEGCSVGQPVNVTNGNMWLKQQDYLLPGFGESVEITRFYNSITQTNGLFGSGWTSQYDDALTIFSGGKMLRLTSADGRAAYFGRLSTTEPFTSFSPHVTGSIVVSSDLSYTLTYKDGRVRNFSPTGMLMWQRDRNGNQTTLNYNNGVLTGITDAAGRVLSISSNANGNVTQLSDATSVVATYEYYPSTNLLKTVTYNDGSKYQFEYDTTTAPGKVLLTTVKDALNNILETHVYDSQGRATTSERQGGVEKYTLAYNQTDPTYGAFTNVTDANGDVTKYFFTRQSASNLITRIEGACACGGSSSQVTTYEYDTNLSWLNLTKTTDALGRQTTYLYDNNRNITRITDVLGTQTFTYNPFGEVLKYRDRVDSQNPDPNVATVTNTYDANGNLLTSKDALNNTTTLTYTSLGQPATIKDARNNTTALTWDTHGRMTKIKDANNKNTNFGYDARARVTSVTDALSQTTTLQYDLNNRLKKLIYPDTNFVENTYDLAGRRTALKDARGNTTNFAYDGAYRLTSVTDPLSHTTTYGYDLMSNLTSQTDALSNVTQLQYDEFNRLKKVIYPVPTPGATPLEESLTYDLMGNVKTRVDTEGRTTAYDYDGANRLIKITDALLNQTHFEYNARSHMTKVKDALNQEYIFTYDALGRQLSQTRAGATMSFEYDSVGNRTKRTDYMGRETAYEYDVLNRLKKINYLSAGNPVPATSATYNYDDLSRLTTAINNVGTVSFTYDNRNRLKTETDVFGHLVEYGYDPNGNRTQLKLDGNVHATYAYDTANRLATLTDDASQNFTYGYDTANRLISKALPNGITTTYDYDGMSRLKRLKDASTSATLFDRQYTYNSANQIGQIAELTQTKDFTYDNIDRLTSMTNGPTSENYVFDSVGNRTASHRSASYGYQPFNRLTSTATSTQNLDANGNTVSKSEGSNFWRYVWDGENRLSTASTRKQTVRYTYDALGRRVVRNLGGGRELTKFTYDGDDVLVDENGGTLTKYQNGLGIDNKLRVQTGSDAKYFLADHLGSTNGLTDSTGTLTSQNAYDSFGNQTGSLATRYGFTGRERDDFTGLMHYRARLYDPNLGRFISEDPIGFGGGDVNLYGYVWNNPPNLVDPFGKFGWCKDVDGSVRPCPAFRALSRALGNWNPWISVEAEGVAHFLTAGATVSTGIIVNPLTCEVCRTSKICVNRGGGGFIGAGTQLGLQTGPYRGADRLFQFEEQSELNIEGGEGLGLGFSGSASTNSLAIGIKPELGAGAYVGSNLCTGAVTHCYFSPNW